MFKVLFKTSCAEDVQYVREVIMSRHTPNGDTIIVSCDLVQADIVINVPKVKKRAALIFDHSGSVHRLGFPDDIEYDELPGKSDGLEESSSVRDQERREKKPKECTSCHYMKPAGVYVCPKCGFKPLAGEDVDVDTSRNIKKMGKSEKVYTTKDKQSFYSQLKYYQNIRAAEGKPVSDGWVSNTFRDKFGEWPRSLHATPQEITPEVSNFITHKRIQWVKRKQKTEALMPQRIADLKQQLNKNAQQGELL
ncbi:TPA: ATP-dependent helicase [Morganella morganii]